MDDISSFASHRFVPTCHPAGNSWEESSPSARQPIGRIVAISGSGAEVRFDAARLRACMDETDPCVAMTGQVGSQVKVKVPAGWLLATVHDQRQMQMRGDDNPGAEQDCFGHIDFLGEGLEDSASGRIHNFTRGVTSYPIPGAEVYPATTGDLRQIHAGDGRDAIQIGSVYPAKDINAGLYVDALLGRHFALLGSTGTGKSTAVALLLHRICDIAPQGHIVLIDPHGEYSSAFRDRAELIDVSNLKMPYWLMNLEEHSEVLLRSHGAELQEDRDILAKCLLQARQKSRLAESMGRVTVDSPIPYLITDLARIVQDEMGQLEKASTAAPYMRIKTKLEEMRNDPRYQFMFSGMLVADTMAQFIARVFRLPSDGKPLSIIDVSGVPSDITRTVVAVLSRMVFDFAIWNRSETTRPILFVCEEAHRYIPSDRDTEVSSVRSILSRIAKEGRKYGISLGLVTQRPSDLAEGVLSQCGTIITMRLNNERDQAFVKAAMPESAKGMLDSIPALRNRECIICGEGVSIPIRAGFDHLEEGRRPASDDPSFSALWQQSGGEAEAIERVVHRWRSQGR